MQPPLNASASSAGALLSGSTFEVPPFQREYSWGDDEVSEFWSDLRNNIESESYFLGLIILTEHDTRKHVVDGQQRIITLSLLASAIYHEAIQLGRKALADRIYADFLYSIDYDSDDSRPRVELSDEADNGTFHTIVATGKPPGGLIEHNSVSQRIVVSFEYLSGKLRDDLREDPFKRLGKWTEFLTHRVYFAVFIHPDPSSAYQVYEVINTRGKELTTADLLKSYILSQAAPAQRKGRYIEWQAIAKHFQSDSTNTFVQFIRHAVTVRSGHILPKDLFSFLAGRKDHGSRLAPRPDELMHLLHEYLPLYVQMMDPTLAGPADGEALGIFSALNSLSVMAVRPILLSLARVPNSLDGMKYVLRLVVRRIVVGNLGTGNVERIFGEAARKVHDENSWKVLTDDFRNLNPTKQEFVDQLRKRSFNKAVLSFLRRSILFNSITPPDLGVLHYIWTRQASDWSGMGEDEGSFWASTIGNTFLADLDRRPKAASDWAGFKRHLLPHGIEHEWKSRLLAIPEWNATTVEQMGLSLAEAAGEVWYE